jgi:hypothetical protein
MAALSILRRERVGGVKLGSEALGSKRMVISIIAPAPNVDHHVGLTYAQTLSVLDPQAHTP